MCTVSGDKFWTKAAKRLKKKNPTATFKEPGAKEGAGEQKLGAHTTA